MNKVSQYIKDSIHELRSNVTWTPMDELQKYTTIVITSLFLITLLIWIMDLICQAVMVTGIYQNA